MSSTSADKRKRVDPDPVTSIASRMNLREGEEAVRRVLREVHRMRKVGTKDLARGARLPIPVTAAIRRELEKGGLLRREGGAVLTPEGEAYVTEVLGFVWGVNIMPAPRDGGRPSIPDEYTEVLERLRTLFELRPAALPQLDQAHATPETSLRRALYMQEEGDLGGRAVLFLGDDDLTSVAAGLLKVARRISVVDIDERLLKVIEEISTENGLGIETVCHDLRNPLPEGLRGVFDIVVTDPPYTVPGVEVFLSRGIEALRSLKMSTIYLSFADKPPLEMLGVHRAITGMGVFVRELIPRFNEYVGAEMFANITSMMRLSTTDDAEPAVKGVYEGAMYTGEVNPTVRVYRCRCGTEIRVGAGETYGTVEELKERGCPSCRAHEGFRLRRRVKLQGGRR
jgi:predicted methyltransferase